MFNACHQMHRFDIRTPGIVTVAETPSPTESQMNSDASPLIDQLMTCSYTDFVGAIAQTNVPPGAFSTVNQWVLYSHMNSSSYVYEAACTTGFSLRESARLSGCSGEGADVSAMSVATANRMIADTELRERIAYHHADAVEHSLSQRPTHIIVGAALRFFPDPQRMLARCADLLGDSGYLLAAPFYTTSDIPQSLLQEAERVLGIVPTTDRYKHVMSLYRGFQIVFESRQAIEMETAEELHHYCDSTAMRALRLLGQTDDRVYRVIYDRLMSIKDLCNRLRPYQAYSSLVLRYRSSEYPNRYVELF